MINLFYNKNEFQKCISKMYFKIGFVNKKFNFDLPKGQIVS